MAKKKSLPEIRFKGVYEAYEMHYHADCDKSRALLSLMKNSFLRINQFQDVANLGFSIVTTGNNRESVAEMRKNKMDYVLADDGLEYIGEEV